MKQSKFQLIQFQEDATLFEMYSQHGSITKVLKYFGYKNNDPRARKYISHAIERITGNTQHSDQHKMPFDTSLFLRVAPHCSSITEVIQKMGLQPVGGNFAHIKTHLTKHSITLRRRDRKKWSDDKVYCRSSSFPRRALRGRVVRDGWLSYQCDVCNNEGEWLGSPICLHLDHINGNNTDHRKENLRWLCPNCHAQTPTYGGRNNKK